MKIPVNFLPMGRFTLDKNPTGDCERAYRDFCGDFFWEAYRTPGVLEESPIEDCFALDNGGEHLFVEHMFDFLELCVFHAFPPPPLDVSIISC